MFVEVVGDVLIRSVPDLEGYIFVILDDWVIRVDGGVLQMRVAFSHTRGESQVLSCPKCRFFLAEVDFFI